MAEVMTQSGQRPPQKNLRDLHDWGGLWAGFSGQTLSGQAAVRKSGRQ